MNNKKIFAMIIFVAILVFVLIIYIITNLSNADIVGIPKGYVEKEEYYDKDSFQDYTDYAKYKYLSKKTIVDNEEYIKITEEDINNIKGYFENFYNWMKSLNRLNEYDFDTKIINEGDYVKIKTKEGQSIGNSRYDKYNNYSIYFIDTDTLTLYYIHSNI